MKFAFARAIPFFTVSVLVIGEKDKIIGVAIVTEEKTYVLVLSSNGYCKKTDVNEYRLQGRGGSGVKAMNTTAKTGDLVALDAVSDNDDILITTRQGIVIMSRLWSGSAFEL